MGNVLRVFIRDLKRLAKAPAAWVVALFLIVLPSLYAWINVYGFWNPYDNTQNLAVCVVNEDAGTKDKLLGHLDLGDQIVDDLRENDQMGWEFVDRDQAMAAVESGRAYAAFVIPRSFSADVAALASGRLEQAQIEYYVNEKTGPVAPKIMDKGATTLDTTINSAFVSQVSSTVVEALEGTSAEVKQEVAEKATASFERVDKAIDTLGGIRDSLGTLEDTAESAQRKSADARTSLADEKKSIEGLADDLDRMADLVAEANESSARLSQQLGNALDTGGQALSLAASQTNLAIARTAAKVTAAKGDVDGAVNRMNAVVQEQAQIVAAMRTVEQLLPDGDARQSIGEAIAPIEKANDEAAQIVNGLATLSADIDATARSVAGASDAVNDAAQQAIDVGAGYRSTVNGETLPAVSDGIASLGAASADLAATVASQTALIDQAIGSLKQLETALEQSAKAFSQTGDLLADAQDDLSTIKADLVALGTSESLHDLLDHEVDATKVADFMLSPTTVKTEELYPLDAYGSAMAPLFINLTLWIGVFMLMVIMRMEVDAEGVEETSVPQRYLGRLLLLACMAALQAIVCCTGCLAIGVQVASAPLFVLTAVIGSLAYLAIQYALSSTFQHLGKALCVILVFIQIPGATGLYPIEMTTDFFRTMYPLFPFTYGINAIRETVFGFYGNLWAGNIAVLAGFLAGFTVFGALARPLTANLNRLFEQQLKQSDLINIEAVQLPDRRYKVSHLISVISSRDEYRRNMESRAEQFARNYPRIKRVAVVAGIIAPVVATPIFVATNVDKVIILTIWLIWLIAISIVLIVAEFLRDSIEHQLSLSELSNGEISRLYFGGSGSGMRKRVADGRERLRAAIARQKGDEPDDGEVSPDA
ncbi:MAG: YhgE/Pip domain-containing protein [Coriobacteriaceae bacterium]|nr:YhgE/Pip domain-containing protein [Coriobacteriaceae bacterium]